MNQLETIGIDFGGTNTRVAHFEGDRILKLIEFATPKRPEEFIEMSPSNPLQSEEPGIGNDSFYAASAVSPNANH